MALRDRLRLRSRVTDDDELQRNPWNSLPKSFRNASSPHGCFLHKACLAILFERDCETVTRAHGCGIRIAAATP
jgi:hypothetical protein